MLHSRWVDLLRKAKTQKRDDGGALPLDAPEAQRVRGPQHSPSQTSAQREEWRDLLTELWRLPEDQRDALSLFYLQQTSLAEIAVRLERSEEAVKSLRARGVRTLEARMKGKEEQEPRSPDDMIVHGRVDAALSVYFRRLEEGVPVEPLAFVAEYPDCADELRRLLYWLEGLRALQERPPA